MGTEKSYSMGISGLKAVSCSRKWQVDYVIKMARVDARISHGSNEI